MGNYLTNMCSIGEKNNKSTNTRELKTNKKKFSYKEERLKLAKQRRRQKIAKTKKKW